jgi:protein-L-isoaspartate(D-aspartate) O-methyltransferase
MKKMDDLNSLSDRRSDMVESQIKRRGINNESVLQAFRAIPRHNFVPEEYQADAYRDHPLPIGNGQTISQPYIVALMTNALQLIGNEKVLEIGTGSGYQTAILAYLVKEVHSVELIPQLSSLAKRNLRILEMNNIFLHIGDGCLGWPDGAPYDRILITAAAPDIPEKIIEQLKINGRVVSPVGGRWRQTLEVWIKQKNRIKKEQILPVVFVPLRGAHGWQD